MSARLRLLAIALLLSACRSEPPPSTAATTAKPRAQLHRGPLTDYVASAGLRWMLVGSPAKLLANADVARAVARLIPPERLDRFAQASGIDLRTTPSALVAGFDYATLYAAVAADTALVERRFTERLLSGPLSAEPVPGLRRVSGVIGSTPQTLITIEGELIAVAVGDPTPVRVVEAYARGKLRKSPIALKGSALSTLPAAMHTADVRFYAPGPFHGEWTAGARGLLAGAVALGIAARPVGSGQLAAVVHVTGDFGSDTEARSALLAAWRDLSESSLGKLLGFNRPVSEPVLSGERDLLSLEVTLELEPIARGLHAAVSADVWQMLELSPPADPRH